MGHASDRNRASPPSPDDWVTALRRELPVTEQCVYLQTGTKGPILRSAWEAWRDAEWLAMREGPVSPVARSPMLEMSERARAALARLLGVPTSELCWSINTSTAMRTVFHGLRPGPNDTIITSDLEHAATRSLCQGLREDHGVELDVIAADGTDGAFLDQLESALKRAAGRRAIVLLSHVSCITGHRLPVAEAAAIARRHGGISVIDGAQAVGQFPVDLARIGADFYIASGHKWLLGPTGVGYVHVHADRLSAFNPNWVPAADRVQPTAAVLGEAGSVNWAQRAALRVAVERMLEIGVEAIEAHAASLALRLRRGLAALPGAAILGPDEPARTTGLISFTLADLDADACRALVDRLHRRHRVLIKFQPERTALRVSLAAFNTSDDVDALLDALGDPARSSQSDAAEHRSHCER